MNKKGFTLVELLAVIAILAILVIIALPNIMSMFNDARKNSFTTELKEIYKLAEQQWMSDSLFTTSEKAYSRSTTNNCTNSLDLSGRNNLEYYIRLNKAGKVVEFEATDGTYQYMYEGEGLQIQDITDVVSVTELGDTPSISITCDGISYVFANGGGGDPEQGYFYNLNKSKYYDDFQEAIDDASGHDTIKLLKEYNDSPSITIPSSITGLTLDLNGNMIRFSSTLEKAITNNGKLTIINSDLASSRTDAYLSYYEKFENNGTLNLNGAVELMADCDNLYNNGTININGGYVGSQECSAIMNDGTVTLNDGYIGGNDAVVNHSTFVMNGGETYGYYGNANSNGATITINGGILRGTTCALGNSQGGTMNVKNAEIRISYPFNFSVISNSGVLNLTNVTISCTMSGYADSTCIKNFSTGNVHFYSGTITAHANTNSGKAVGINNQGTLVFHSGTITDTSSSNSIPYGSGITSSGNTTILDGTITAAEHAIRVEDGGTVTIGTKDSSVSTTTPVMQCDNQYGYGIKIDGTGKLNFYDGIIKAKRTNYSLSGTLNDKPTGYILTKETVSGYETQYLIQE